MWIAASAMENGAAFASRESGGQVNYATSYLVVNIGTITIIPADIIEELFFVPLILFITVFVFPLTGRFSF